MSNAPRSGHLQAKRDRIAEIDMALVAFAAARAAQVARQDDELALRDERDRLLREAAATANEMAVARAGM